MTSHRTPHTPLRRAAVRHLATYTRRRRAVTIPWPPSTTELTTMQQRRGRRQPTELNSQIVLLNSMATEHVGARRRTVLLSRPNGTADG